MISMNFSTIPLNARMANILGGGAPHTNDVDVQNSDFAKLVGSLTQTVVAEETTTEQPTPVISNLSDSEKQEVIDLIDKIINLLSEGNDVKKQEEVTIVSGDNEDEDITSTAVEVLNAVFNQISETNTNIVEFKKTSTSEDFSLNLNYDVKKDLLTFLDKTREAHQSSVLTFTQTPLVENTKSQSEVKTVATQLVLNVAQELVAQTPLVNESKKSEVVQKLEQLITELKVQVNGSDVKTQTTAKAVELNQHKQVDFEKPFSTVIENANPNVQVKSEVSTSISSEIEKLASYSTINKPSNDATNALEFELNEIVEISGIGIAQATSPQQNQKVTQSPEVQVSNFIGEQLNTKTDFVVKELTLKLNPEELGEISVHITKKLGEISIKIIAENTNTAKILEKGAMSLALNLQTKTPEVREVVVISQSDNNAQGFFNSHQGQQEFNSQSFNGNSTSKNNSNLVNENVSSENFGSEVEQEKISFEREGKLWQTA